jgi:uncharacterized protein
LEKNKINMRVNYSLSIIKSLAIYLSLSAILMAPLSGQDLPDKPVPPRLVVDYAGTLNPSELAALENKLVKFNDTTSNQILIVLTDNLLGYTPEEYATGIGEKWGVGQAEFDNGVVIVVKPKIGNNQGRAFIAVGYGLEGAIPDITTGHIVDNEMIPYFRQNNYYAGLDAATTVIMELAAGEYTSDEYQNTKGNNTWRFLIIFFLLLIFIIIRRGSRGSRTISSRSMSPWTAFWIGSMMSGSGRGGRGGSSGGSFGGGGGFGGFGGGGFGGGGAGGSW